MGARGHLPIAFDLLLPAHIARLAKLSSYLRIEGGKVSYPRDPAPLGLIALVQQHPVCEHWAGHVWQVGRKWSPVRAIGSEYLWWGIHQWRRRRRRDLEAVDIMSRVHGGRMGSATATRTLHQGGDKQEGLWGLSDV